MSAYSLMMANLEDGLYKNTVPFVARSKDIKAWIKHDEEEKRMYQEFKKDTLTAYGVADNPRADKCFELAWSYGHSEGYHEVLSYFEDLVDLIK